MKLNFWLDRLLTSKTTLKILSVFIAVVIWVYAGGGFVSDVNRRFVVKVDYINLAKGLLLFPSVSEVEVQLIGNKAVIDSLNPNQIKCMVNLSELGPGVYKLPVEVFVPPGLKLVYVRPTNIDVKIEKLLRKEFPVEVVFQGYPKDGFIVKDVKISPKTVYLEGPQGEVNSVSKVKAIINVKGVDKSFKLDVPLILESKKKIESVKLIPLRVRAYVDVVKGWPQKEVVVKPVIRGSLKEGFELVLISVNPQKVKVKGPISKLKELNELYTEPIDLSFINKTRTFKVKVILPDESLSFVSSGDEYVDVKVEVKERYITKTFNDVFVHIKGKGVYKSWKVSPKKVTVVIVGPKSLVESYLKDKKQPYVYVDISNIVSKKTEVQVEVSLPAGLTYYVKPSKVEVTAVTD